jgi:hypothetical protein
LGLRAKAQLTGPSELIRESASPTVPHLSRGRPRYVATEPAGGEGQNRVGLLCRRGDLNPAGCAHTGAKPHLIYRHLSPSISGVCGAVAVPLPAPIDDA